MYSSQSHECVGHGSWEHGNDMKKCVCAHACVWQVGCRNAIQQYMKQSSTPLIICIARIVINSSGTICSDVLWVTKQYTFCSFVLFHLFILTTERGHAFYIVLTELKCFFMFVGWFDIVIRFLLIHIQYAAWPTWMDIVLEIWDVEKTDE